MYKLYYTTRSYTTESTALIPRITLEEIGVKYEVIEVELEPTPPNWYVGVNPHGKIPTLVETHSDWTEDAVVYPSSAILLYLSQRHPEAALFPVSEPERASGYRALLDMAEMVQSAFMMFFYADRFCADERGISGVREKALEWLVHYSNRIDDSLHDTPYLIGKQHSICDIYLYVLTRWYVDIYNRIDDGPLRSLHDLKHLAAFCSRVETRPAVERSLAADEISFLVRDGEHL